MKFGGSSVKEPQNFDQIAKIIKKRSESYHNIVVVVSAMGNTTDHLLQLAKKVSTNPPQRELDMLISCGERISIALLAMALDNLGVKAISFTGSQSGILTTQDHTDALIKDIRPLRIIEALEKGNICIVAGFQGVSNREITTLGRGGSDTTAVALAVALKAEKVEFYKDVKGIFEKDPKKDNLAKVYEKLSYDQALVIVEKGEVLHKRAVQLAKKNQVYLQLLSFEEFDNQNIENLGTKIGDCSKEILQKEFEVCPS